MTQVNPSPFVITATSTGPPTVSFAGVTRRLKEIRFTRVSAVEHGRDLVTGYAAAAGHETRTGMRVCVSTRHFCINNGVENALLESADRQCDVGSPDDRGLLPAEYHRDRIPYGGDLTHAQFKQALVVCLVVVWLAAVTGTFA